MDKDKIKNIVIGVCVFVIIVGTLIMFGGKSNSNKQQSNNGSENIPVINNGDMTMPEANAITDEILGNTIVEQKFIYNQDTISEVAIVFTRKRLLEGINIGVALYDGNKVLAEYWYKVDGIEDQHRTYLKIDKKITGVKGKELTLRIYSDDKKDTGMAIMMQENNQTTFKFGNKVVNGTLCFSVSN